MEPSKILGGSEECHSDESGWTMYIGSLIQGTDKSDDDGLSEAGNGGRTHADETDANHEADSDDSLASDASSGQIHRGHGTWHFKHDEDEKKGDCYLDKKAKKSVKKKRLGMVKKERKEEKDQMTFMEKGATTHDPSGSKGKCISA